MSRPVRFSFGAGEITPEMFGRADMDKYNSGLELCENFIVLPHGPAANRPGTEFIFEVKDSSKTARLIPFSFSAEQTYAIEFGDQYIRFHTQGGVLLSGGVPYEISSPYLEADLFDLHYIQSADVLTIVHPNYAPRELRRLGATSWTLTTISFVPTIAAPVISGTATDGTGGGTPITHYYLVTAVAAGTLEESEKSNGGTANFDLTVTGNTISVSWGAVTGAIRYNVYKQRNGVYGYIGQTPNTVFTDDNIAPDTENPPPEYQNPFGSAGNYPGAVTYYEQRRCFGGTTNSPQSLSLTRSGSESNFSYSIPTRDDDAISLTVKAREINKIRHMLPLGDLVLLTSGGEWRVSSGDSFALTPTTIRVRPQGYAGASSAQPVVTDNSALYVQAEGAHVRELTYDENGSLRSLDISVLAAHLFDYHSIDDIAYVKGPVPLLWAVRDDGVLLGLTYLPAQQVIAWHRHVTVNGAFESVCAIAEGGETALYCIVKRTIGGATKRYIERLHTRRFETLADAFFVDSGLSYSGTPVSTVSGLDHLEGETVVALADGAVQPAQVVTGGQISVQAPASKIHVGLPITATLRTLPLSLQMEAFGQGRSKNVSRVWLRVYRSSGIFAGPSLDKLTEAKQRTTEPYGSPPSLKTDEIELMISPEWNRHGAIYVQQRDPIPLTLLSMSMDVSVGG